MFKTHKRSTKPIPIVKPKINKDFEQSLKKYLLKLVHIFCYYYFIIRFRLCQNLLSFLKEAQESADVAEQRLKQAQAILKPWPAPPKDDVECLCKNLESTTVTECNDDLALMDNISKTLDSAKALRLKEKKSSSKLLKGGGKSSSSSISEKSSLTSDKSSCTSDKSGPASARSTSTADKSISASGKFTSVRGKSASIRAKSALIGGKHTSTASKSISASIKSSSSKTSTSAVSKTSINIATQKSASTVPTSSSLSSTSKTSSATTKVFSNIDSTRISLQSTTVPSKPGVHTDAIPKASSSTMKRSPLRPSTVSSKSTVHSSSKVNFVFTNTASSTVLQMSSKDPFNVNTKPVQFTLQNTCTTLPEHSGSITCLANTQLVPSSVSNTSVATGSSCTERSSAKTISIQPRDRSSRVSFSKKSISAPIIPTPKNEIDSSKSKTKLHCPSCPCYKTEDEEPKPTTLSLSEALAVYPIPSTLRRTAKYYHRFLLEEEKEESSSSKSDPKAEFLQALEKRVFIFLFYIYIYMLHKTFTVFSYTLFLDNALGKKYSPLTKIIHIKWYVQF